MKDAAKEAACRSDEKLNEKVARSGVEAARRKFTPEFINRLDKIVVFRPLGESELRKILDIELNMVQQRIFNASPDRAFIFHVTEAGKAHLLREGIDPKYGARHLKRAIEKLLVQPLSNLIATDQIQERRLDPGRFQCGMWPTRLPEGSGRTPDPYDGGIGGQLGYDAGPCAQQRSDFRSRPYSIYGARFKARLTRQSAFTNPRPHS